MLTLEVDETMSTQWYWRDGESTRGPVPFQELAGMVRDHLLNEDDLVRPHYAKDTDWQTTDSVIGLFHMAQRIPIPRPEPPPEIVEAELPVEDQQGDFGSDLDEMFAVAEQIVEEDNSLESAGVGAAGVNISMGSRSGWATPNFMASLLRSSEPKPQKRSLARTVSLRLRHWVQTHKLLSVVAGVMVIVGGGWTAQAFSRSSDLLRYQELQKILVSIEQQRSSPQPEFAGVRAEIGRIIREYPDALIREGASRRLPVKQKFLHLSRDLFPDLLKSDMKSRSVAERHVMAELDEVGVALGVQ